MSNPSDSESETKVFGRIMRIAVRVVAQVQRGAILELFTDTRMNRDVLPELLDIADHIGNFREGSLVMSVACA